MDSFSFVWRLRVLTVLLSEVIKRFNECMTCVRPNATVQGRARGGGSPEVVSPYHEKLSLIKSPLCIFLPLLLLPSYYFYNLRRRRGNAFGRVCLSVPFVLFKA